MAPHILLLIVVRLLFGPPMDVLVDQNHGLPGWYAPGSSAVALEALDELIQAAWQDQIRVAVYSGYRSYEDQLQALGRARLTGQAEAEYFLAQPGHSEHQLGTAFDVVWPGLQVEFADPRNQELYEWLETHAHRYGFVISYPLRIFDQWPFSNRWMPYITEFIYEPWHIRYVGIPLATEIFEAGYLDPASKILPQDFYRSWP
ncbi:MAG: M15 family metallopeptidase [Anaerolineales bacterium]